MSTAEGNILLSVENDLPLPQGLVCALETHGFIVGAVKYRAIDCLTKTVDVGDMLAAAELATPHAAADSGAAQPLQTRQ